ncbi:MAG TPA: gamma-glutamyltransferase [Ignavibacteria bacterium]
MKIIYSTFILFVFIFTSFHFSYSQNLSFQNGVVSSANELASAVGIDVMKKGGNAIDAAVAVGFTLSVVYPQAGNIGGGGFMVIHFPDGKNIALDYREKAPSQAYKDMFLDLNGNVIEDLSTTGPLAAGIPGSVAGMLYALEKYGTMSREKIISYAIDLAENGFKINDKFASLLNSQQSEFKGFKGTLNIFGGKFKDGDIIIQKDLANTLREISLYGRDGFYKGKTAEMIINEVNNNGGIFTYSDLENYNVIEREVLKSSYRGYEIISMPLPSSGGICLINMLNMLENYNLTNFGFGTPEYIHLTTEAMRRAYADRSEYLGDADFINVSVDILISKQYAKDRMIDFNPNIAGKSSEIKKGDVYKKEHTETTHYSVADKSGLCVSVTTTLNDNFGNKEIVEGAGFFLNNEMDDFVIKPGTPNIYGLIGTDANSIAPNKRMLSSMTPTIILKDTKPFMILGSPGGGRIITTVLQTIINVIDFGMDLETAVESPRFHHQWYPDEIVIEKNSLSLNTKNKLIEMGHNLKEIINFGRIDAIMFLTDGFMTGISDTRGYGKSIGF